MFRPVLNQISIAGHAGFYCQYSSKMLSEAKLEFKVYNIVRSFTIERKKLLGQNEDDLKTLYCVLNTLIGSFMLKFLQFWILDGV